MFNFQNSSVIYVSSKCGNNKYYNGLAPVADSYGNGPFETIEQALNSVRELRQTGNFRPLTIALCDDYFMEKPISISSDVFGVTIESFGERAKILGGIKVEGFKKDTFNGMDCISAKMPEKKDGTLWDFTDLFVNGKRAKATRYPENGTFRAVDTKNNISYYGTNCASIHTASSWFIANKADLEEVDNIEDAILNFYHLWVDEHTPIKSYNRETGKLEMLYRSRFAIDTEYEYVDDRGEIVSSPAALNYFLTNVPNTFKNAGEWYLERKTGKVYYIPEADLDLENLEVYAPVASSFFKIASKDIIIKNIEFAYTGGDYVSRYVTHPNNVYLESEEFGCASDVQSVCFAPAAISFENSVGCSVENCSLHGVGIHAVGILEGCSRVSVTDNEIYDIHAGGVKVLGGAVGCENSKITSDCEISRNKISYCGRRYAAGCGILVMHASYMKICDNEIHDLDYSGISVGWVWGYADSNTYGNLIKGNHIYNIGKGNLSDMGGVYTLGKQQGTVICENHIHDISSANYGGWGIYTDEGSSYITIENNLVYRTHEECFHQHYGSQNTVRNNIFAFGGTGIIRLSRNEMHEGAVLENNIFLTDGAPIYPYNCSMMPLCCSKNMIWDISGKEPILHRNVNGVEFGFSEWQLSFCKDNDSVIANPCFVDAKSGDFTFEENSPLRNTQFKITSALNRKDKKCI